MINAVHAIIHSTEPDATRSFFRDVLGWSHVDAGEGWLIFALPPAELGIHPAENSGDHQLFLMCDDIQATIAELKGKGVTVVDPVAELDWGKLTQIDVPGGGRIGLYEPKHPMAVTI